jgi:hypothetical protein
MKSVTEEVDKLIEGAGSERLAIVKLMARRDSILDAGAALQEAAENFKAVATFREKDDNCYHCGANETQMHSPKCQFVILQNAVLRAIDKWTQITK